jgi:predicted adenylyl cyclase CyaB
MKKEKEIKVKIESEKKFKEYQKKVEVERTEPIRVIFQRTYFFSKGTPKDTFLRVREEGNEAVITLKINKNKKISIFEREEYEIELKDKNEAKEAVEIFKRLGFSGIRILEKIRTIYNTREAEISFDRLPFGFFMEIEANSKEKIERELKRLKINKDKITKDNYWKIFDEQKKKREKNCIFKSHLTKKYEAKEMRSE